MPFGEASDGDLVGEGEEDSEKMIGDSPVEHSFKNKGTVKTHTLSLASILLVQNFADIGEAGAEMIAVTIGTCKGSLNQSWGCSSKTLRCSSQYSTSTEMECSSGNFSRVSR